MQFYNKFSSFPEFVNHFRNHPKYQKRNSFVDNIEVPQKSISICTTCMNRLHDIKRTLPKNIADNSDYKSLEFVLLDYHSVDGLGHWVKNKMMEHIESGKLIYYRTVEPQYFCPNHSRNVSFRLATGDIVTNVDTDNFTHNGYAKVLNGCAAISNRRVLILPENFLLPNGKQLFLKGRFALYRKDIEMLRGFDEDLDQGFSNDDLNFVFRAMLAGFKIVRFPSSFTEGRLPTTDNERTALVRNPDIRATQAINAQITHDKLTRGKITVNPNHWGKCVLTKNFTETVEI